MVEAITAHLSLFALLASLLIVIVALIVVLMLTKKTTRRLIEILGLTRHALISWLFVPLFRFYFLLLQIFGKLRIKVNSAIPWEERGLIIAANHGMPKLQDTFLLPTIIFFLRPKNYLNPIRYFPKSTADETNFVHSWFFRFIGSLALSSVNRHGGGSLLIEKEQQRFQERGGIEIFYVERGRTKTAVMKGRAKTWTTPEGGTLALGRPGLGAAELSLKTKAPIVTLWGKITNDDSYPKGSPQTVLIGLLELLFSPKKKVFIDIGHPAGPLKPLPGETSRELTARIETALFQTGEYQLRPMSKR
jgi:1-acyl-sn-glycerol-3-phosphate acyltransferase